MEEVGEVRLRDFEIMPRRHLHLRQTVAGGMNESRRPEIGIRRATVHDEPEHFAEDLPDAKKAQRMLCFLGSKLDHQSICQAAQSRDVLRGFGAVARPGNGGRHIGDELVLESRLFGPRERREIRPEVVSHRETAATSG